MKNDQTLQQPITHSRQQGTQTTPVMEKKYSTIPICCLEFNLKLICSFENIICIYFVVICCQKFPHPLSNLFFTIIWCPLCCHVLLFFFVTCCLICCHMLSTLLSYVFYPFTISFVICCRMYFNTLSYVVWYFVIRCLIFKQYIYFVNNIFG